MGTILLLFLEFGMRTYMHRMRHIALLCVLSLLVAVIFNDQMVFSPALKLYLLHTQESSYAVLVMDNIIPDI